MKRCFFLTSGIAFLTLAGLTSPSLTQGAEAGSPSAAELASRLNSDRQDGTSFLRLRMEVSGGGSIQIQSKERHTKAGSDVVFQVLFPKERKGESVLLRKPSGGAASGTVFTPPDSLKNLSGGQLKEGVFGGDLSYEDLVENFFSWEKQTLVGSENVGRVSCQILESKPGTGDRTSYASVKTWLDTKRKVPMRVEKYNASGTVVVRIETQDVNKDDIGRQLPSSLRITRAGGSASGTVLEGSRIKHGVSLTDADFTPEALKTLSTPK